MLSRKISGQGDERQELLFRWSDRWIEAVSGTRNSAPPGSLIEVRYEDLCSDVHGHIRRILSFVGLDPSRFPYFRCPATLQATNQRRFAGATDNELRTIELRQKDLLTKYGYELEITSPSGILP